ncbi:MAG: D-glycerate dehydrogenase [candidate division WOR-3 bacterium]
MSSRKKVYCTAKLTLDVRELLRDFDVEVYEGPLPIPLELLKEKIIEVDGLITMLTDKIDASVLANAQKLKIIANYAVGFDNIDISECTKRGITVTNTPDVLTDATAELAWALVFAVARRVIQAHKFVEANKWKSWSPTLFLGKEIRGKTVGVVGAGRIGTAFAMKSKGFDTKILYFSRKTNAILEENLGAKKVSLEDLLKESDIISLHLPLTPETYHIIGEKEFNLMKPEAIFINTGRGKLVDEKALIRALKERRIFGAGLDVFEHEPHVPEELKELDNVVLLPHIGSATIEARTKMVNLVAENIKAFFSGQMPPNVVNKELYGL